MKAVHMQALTWDIKRAMLTATVTMKGEVLPLLLIQKGQKNVGVQYSATDNPSHVLYAIQNSLDG